MESRGMAGTHDKFPDEFLKFFKKVEQEQQSLSVNGNLTTPHSTHNGNTPNN